MYAIPHQFIAEIAAQRRVRLEHEARVHTLAKAARRPADHPVLAPIPQWRRVPRATPGTAAPVSP